MTNYQEGNDPQAGVPGPPYPNQGPNLGPGQGQVPPEPYAQQTASYPTQQPPPGPAWDRGPDQYGDRMRRREHHRPRVQVRSTFLTTEFWTLLVVSIGILIAAAVTDVGEDGQAFGAQDAWRFITWLAIGYMISRGLTKLGGNRRDGGDGGTSL